MIWLLRHGDAEDAAVDDAARGLTPKGERQAARRRGRAGGAGRRDRRLPDEPEGARGRDRPARLRAARDRARARRGAARRRLRPGGARRRPRDVLLVGHEPDFSRAIQVMTGAHAEMKKGGLAAVDGRVLLSLLRPAQIKRIAASAD